MKLVLAAAAVVAALAAAAVAQAAPPASHDDPFATTQVVGLDVTQLSAAQARRLGVPDAVLPGTAARSSGVGAVAPSSLGPCGACINTCWTTTYRAGADTYTGSYWENDQPVWCGNGSWITYLDVSRHWQSVSIWYSADGEAGPFVDGGCVGCVSIHFTVYGYVTWHPPWWPASHTTIRLALWLQAYGAASYA